MSETVVNTILYDLGLTNSVKESDMCAHAYFMQLCELKQIAAIDFKIIQNKITGKLELHYINSMGQASKLSWMYLFHSHVANEKKLKFAMLNSVHNHIIDADTPLLDGLDTNFIADNSPPSAYIVCPTRKYMFKSVDYNFRDSWIQYYMIHNKNQCIQCIKTIEQINEAVYGC